MKIDFWFPAKTVTSDAAIREYERLVGAVLPTSFREFIVETNGGSKPKAENFTIKESGATTMLAELYGVEELKNDFLTYRFEIPCELVPIGNDIGGDKLCLGISGQYRGKIFLYDHDKRPASGIAKWTDFLLCSDTFDELVESLK